MCSILLPWQWHQKRTPGPRTQSASTLPPSVPVSVCICRIPCPNLSYLKIPAQEAAQIAFCCQMYTSTARTKLHWVWVAYQCFTGPSKAAMTSLHRHNILLNVLTTDFPVRSRHSQSNLFLRGVLGMGLGCILLDPEKRVVFSGPMKGHVHQGALSVHVVHEHSVRQVWWCSSLALDQS